MIRIVAAAALLAWAATAEASIGLTEIPGKDGDGVVTVYYPSSSPELSLRRGPFTFRLALEGTPVRGNGRLIVISHGSGGSPWVHADLARTLVEDGFLVAMPQHRGDNYKDHSEPGPKSWELRPIEVSHAIDVASADSRFRPLLTLDRVGMYGMSAGGHAALTLAGGRWSPARFRDHCDAHIAEDFNGCVGLATGLTGGLLDGFKKRIALWLIRSRFSDVMPRTHTDPRIAAIVAGVPVAADFEMASLAAPRVPLGLVTARRDKWQNPRFHSDAVLAVCAACERLVNLANGGHGALLSPLPPGLTGLVGDLMNDPPGFDRAVLPDIHHKISTFFLKHLSPR